jgi:hypothetical protein
MDSKVATGTAMQSLGNNPEVQKGYKNAAVSK